MTGANKRGDPVAEPAIGVDPAELSHVLGAPGWLRKVGLMSWLLLGVALLIAALVWVASLVQVIVIPVIVAAIIASICSPAVGWLEARRVPRFAGTALVILLIVLAGIGFALMLIQGIVAEIDPISSALKHGLDGLANDLKGLGLSTKNTDLARDAAYEFAYTSRPFLGLCQQSSTSCASFCKCLANGHLDLLGCGAGLGGIEDRANRLGDSYAFARHHLRGVQGFGGRMDGDTRGGLDASIVSSDQQVNPVG